MKNGLLALFFLLMAVFLIAGCNQADEPPNEKEKTKEESGKNEEIVTIAEAFITQLSEGKYDEAMKNFDETMTKEMTSSQLSEIWTQLESQMGNYIDQEYESTVKQDGYQIVQINGLFEGKDVLFTVTIDKNKKIAGFFIR